MPMRAPIVREPSAACKSVWYPTRAGLEERGYSAPAARQRLASLYDSLP